MAYTIKCKKCGTEIEITEALTRQIEEKVVEASKQKLQEEFERNKKLTGQIDELLSEIRQLRRKDEDREIEMKKKLFENEEKIRNEARKKSEEDHLLKDMEREKVISDLKKSLEEAQRKAQQGSQQTQGETLELTVETKLKQEFPTDQIKEVKKGVRGADVTQVVIDKLGRTCGSILWESKNAKWTEGWIAKLKEDQRQAKADLAVLVSVSLPKEIETFNFIKGVWICSWKSFIPLALALRFNLVNIYYEKQNAVGVDEKMKVLYEYLTGNEFKHRVEGIVETFGTLQDDMEREKRWFSAKWARQEKQLRKVMDHTHGMYGDLQGVIGKSLPDIKTMRLESKNPQE
ncbi:MAG: DUF2130 domain-containing protein [bacterium]|nr:DUF2130 domain-containing protein [bacterium]